MGNKNLSLFSKNYMSFQPLLEKDRIIEINGFELYVHDDFRHSRRNVICYSKKLKDYIAHNNLSVDNHEHHVLISEKLYMFDDICVVNIKGYY